MSERNSPESANQGRPVPWRLIVGIVVVVLIIVFLLENTAKVTIRFVGPQVKAPLIVALLIAAVLGSLATLLIQRHRSRK